MKVSAFMSRFGIFKTSICRSHRSLAPDKCCYWLASVDNAPMFESEKPTSDSVVLRILSHGILCIKMNPETAVKNCIKYY